jgi:hypothetical protein
MAEEGSGTMGDPHLGQSFSFNSARRLASFFFVQFFQTKIRRILIPFLS